MMTNNQLILKYTTSSLSTYDPYDLWKTSIGFNAKKKYYSHRYLALPLVGLLTVFDRYINNSFRIGYKKQEYPTVRAQACLALINLYKTNRNQQYLPYIEGHLKWLKSNASICKHGIGWGLNFRWAVSEKLTYNAKMPLTTATPYSLEAFVEYNKLFPSDENKKVIQSIIDFLLYDISYFENQDNSLSSSYSTKKDRVVTNASSYTMYALATGLACVDKSKKDISLEKINKLYEFIFNSQRSDGSILYSPEGSSFIDCFHTCFVLKNVSKTNKIIRLNKANDFITNGYHYLKENFYDSDSGLYRRFSIKNKPSIVKYDLYDNAEMLHLAHVLHDTDTCKHLMSAIKKSFLQKDSIFSQIDIFGQKYNKNMLRWAVMPYLYALSSINYTA